MKKIGKLQLTRVKVKDLKQHPLNPNQGDVGAIVQSLEAHGLFKPVLVQKSTMRIIAGNHTVQACEVEGYDEIDVILHDVDDDQAMRMMLADNEIAHKAQNNPTVLEELLESLAVTDNGLAGTGFDADDLDTLIRLNEARAEQPLSAFDEWAGLPDYETNNKNSIFHTTVHFASDEDAESFFTLIGRPRRASMWWPNNDGHVGSDSSQRYISKG